MRGERDVRRDHGRIRPIYVEQVIILSRERLNYEAVCLHAFSFLSSIQTQSPGSEPGVEIDSFRCSVVAIQVGRE